MRPSTIFALIILLILGIIIVISMGYSYEVKRFPLIIGFPVTALLVAIIIKEIRAKAELKDTPQEVEIPRKIVWYNYLVAPFWMAVFLLKIYLIGFLLGLPLFTFLYLKLHNQSWLLSIILPLVMATIIYGGFIVGLKMQLYEGLLFQ
ncbi:tripartite tricarboxylate transporter TctB family protein [Thermodesulfobacteriota bacterium]